MSFFALDGLNFFYILFYVNHHQRIDYWMIVVLLSQWTDHESVVADALVHYAGDSDDDGDVVELLDVLYRHGSKFGDEKFAANYVEDGNVDDVSKLPLDGCNKKGK